MNAGLPASIQGLQSAAATPLAQRSSESSRSAGEKTAQQRAAASRAKAADAVGRTEGESQTHDRDADGRRAWELAVPEAAEESGDDGEAALPGSNRNSSGRSGKHLDLIG